LTLVLGNKFTVTGWGRLTNNVQSNFNAYRLYKVSSRQLRKARIPGVTKIDCENENLFKGYIDTKTQLCAGGEKGTKIVENCVKCQNHACFFKIS
jgi:hypothetical protein